MKKKKLTDGYIFKGYKAYQKGFNHPNDHQAIVIKLKRVLKKLTVLYVIKHIVHFTTGRQGL